MKRVHVFLLLAGLLPLCAGGLVSGTLYVSPTGSDITGNGTVGNPFLTIQRGVNAATGGDTVRVLPGTFTATVNINKSLVLIGSGPDSATTIQAPADFRTNTAYNYPLPNFVTERAIVHIGAATPINVVMRGCIVDGMRLGPDVSQSVGYSGILAEQCQVVIDHNTIRNVLPADSSGSTWEPTKQFNGKGIDVRGSGAVATIANNFLEQINRFHILIDASDNGALPGVFPSATVRDNTIVGKGVYNGAQKGIWFDSGAWGTASGNTISNLDFPYATPEPDRASGIVAFAGNADRTHRRIFVNNTVSASSFINNKGIYVTGTGDSVADNRITGFRWGIELHDGISSHLSRDTITGGQVGVLVGTDSTTRISQRVTIGGSSPADKNIITGQMPAVYGGSAIALGFRDQMGGSTFLSTIPVDARNNDLGVYDDYQVRTRIWDRGDTTLINGAPVDTVYYSPFHVASGSIKASVRVFLEGPFNVATTLMNNALSTGGYLAGHFVGVTIPLQAVDSITIEIRDSLVGAVARVRMPQPAWLLTDGTIMSFADTSKRFVEFDTSAGNYYIVVRHRDHVAIISTIDQSLNPSVPILYDFTMSPNAAYGSNPMKQIANRFVMYSGDVNQSGLINAADRLLAKNNTGLGGYNLADVNLNGLVNAADRLMVKNNTGVSSQVP